jgi:hypothetical protein
MLREYAPRPYLHPLHTPGGVLLTDIEPADHPWHHGLSFAIAHVNDCNFWGGPTFSAAGGDAGYGDRHDHGQIRERDGALTWTDQRGVALLTERRTVTVRTEATELRIEWTTSLCANENVTIGSPSTEGRPGAGYGGLFWRGSRNFRGGPVATEDARGEENVNGSCSPWLTFGTATGAPATVVLYADPLVREPWFVRSGEYAGAGPALAFHHRLHLPAGTELHRRYGFRAFDGHLGTDPRLRPS